MSATQGWKHALKGHTNASGQNRSITDLLPNKSNFVFPTFYDLGYSQCPFTRFICLPHTRRCVPNAVSVLTFTVLQMRNCPEIGLVWPD
jgi:hypothetical protein